MTRDDAMTLLNSTLQDIDPLNTIDEMDRRAMEALSSFVVPRLITTWPAFLDLLIPFACRLENVVLRLNPPRGVFPDYDWHHCCHALREAYGPHGERAAFDMCRTGVGGLRVVLQTIASGMAREYAKQVISARVLAYWNGLTVDEQIAAVAEYVHRYRHLIPPEVAECSAARLADGFWQKLEQHPWLIREYRQRITAHSRNSESNR